MSEYQKAKQIARQMRMGKTQARELGLKAFRAEMDAGRPDIALKCAKEFQLHDDRVTEAATGLFLELIKRARFDKALEVARSYNLQHGGDQAQAALDAASKVRYDAGGEPLEEIRRLARRAGSARVEASEADQAIELIRGARQARDKDPRVQGRAVLLPAAGEVWLTGDLHGNVENLQRFSQLADLANHPERFLVVQEIVHSRLITADNRDLSFVAVMEAIRLQARFPGQVYYLLGNHDLAVHLDRELVKGGKYLNRYLFRGMAYMYRARYEEVLSEYRKFIADMPAAILAPNGVFMAHSTPKRAYVPSLSRDYLIDEAAASPLKKLRPINAMVNGRDYEEDTAKAFSDQLECDVMLCGHTPTNRGWKIPNQRHLILDSQHGQAHYVRFDLGRRYESAQELAEGLGKLDPEATEELASEDLM
ncbi:MAG: metallophosphoesterase [Planctomycetota bacterium]